MRRSKKGGGWAGPQRVFFCLGWLTLCFRGVCGGCAGQELYTQLKAIDKRTWNWTAFATRYCGGKPDRYGNYNGASNLPELAVILKKRYMVRRLKNDVLKQLPPKFRQRVYVQVCRCWRWLCLVDGGRRGCRVACFEWVGFCCRALVQLPGGKCAVTVRFLSDPHNEFS